MLTEEDKDILRRHYLLEQKMVGIARDYDVAQAAISFRLKRAVARLKDSLKDPEVMKVLLEHLLGK